MPVCGGSRPSVGRGHTAGQGFHWSASRLPVLSVRLRSIHAPKSMYSWPFLCVQTAARVHPGVSCDIHVAIGYNARVDNSSTYEQMPLNVTRNRGEVRVNARKHQREETQ